MTVTKPKIIDKTPKLTKFNNGGKRSKTTKIIWHFTGKAGVKAIDTINNWFSEITKGLIVNGKYQYASSHYLADLDGKLYSYIPENLIAYTSNLANYYSIGVECATIGTDDHYTDEEYKSMVHLGAYLAQEHNLDPKKDFLTHTDIVGKNYKICPRYFVEHPDKWNQFKLDCYNLMVGNITIDDIVNCTNGKGKVTIVQAKKLYLRVLKTTNVHSEPNFNKSSICGKVEPGTSLTITKKVSRVGTDMYLTKAGYYITASNKYIEVFTK